MKFYLLVIISIFLFSCKKAEFAPIGLNIYFENPQPVNNSELSKIPNKFQGLFMSSDSVFLDISDKIITQYNFNTFRIHKTEMDSLKQYFIFSKGKYFSKLNNDVYNFKYFKDSIEMINKRIDTFFIFSKSKKAKRIDGQLVVNYRDSVYWTIKTISLEKNILKVKYIYSEEDLNRIDSLTKVKSKMVDSSSFIIKPSRSEFKHILNLKNLGEDLRYMKVAKSKI